MSLIGFSALFLMGLSELVLNARSLSLRKFRLFTESTNDAVRKDLEWRSFEVDLFNHEQFDPEYLKLNPKGYVPTLVHDGQAIRESTLICEYLDEIVPSPPLMPADAHERVQVRLWSKAVDEGLFEGVTVFSFSAMFRDRMKNMSAEERERRYRNVGNPTRRDRHISMFEQGVDSPYVFRAVGAYETAFKEMEETLADGSDWLVSDMFSLAEVNLAPFLLASNA